jgi:MFS family permease
MGPELSLGVRRRGQRRFLLFTYFNVISFNFLSGNVMTLYALRLGADTLFVGLLAAFLHVAELMPPLGKVMVRRFGAVRVMGVTWFIRYLLMAPLLLAPWLVQQGGGGRLALAVCVISTLGFNVSRGLGITSHNPIVGGITSTRDRGAFLSRNQLIIHTMSIATGAAMALLLQLRADPAGLGRYSIIIGIGIGAGLVASALVFGMPEPLEARRSARTPLLESLRKGLERSGFRRFLAVHFMSFLILSMAGPFLIVLLKRGYQQGDDVVVAFTVIGSFGAIATALLAGMMLDRYGAKPLYFIFTVLVVLSLVLPIVSPAIHDHVTFWFYAGALFFLYSMGAVGVGTSINTYFFSLIQPDERLNLGIVYFLVTGLAGTAGSLLGGWVLQVLENTRGLGDVANGLPAFRVYFGMLAGILVLLLPIILTLEKLGSRDVREVLSTFLSLRDLRAIVLLGRLARSSDLSDERRVIQALGESSSGVPSEELIERLRSPMFSIRMEALNALSNLPWDTDVEKALVSEVRNHHFTTAHVAAEMIGNRRTVRAVRELREALQSRDYMLRASAMVALAQLGDRRGMADIRTIVSHTDNPRLLIYGAQALEIAGGAEALPVLFSQLTKRQYPFVRDEIILSVAGILGFKRDFYPWYTHFLERGLEGLTSVRDFMQERILAGENPVVAPEVLSLALEEATGRGESFAAAVEEALKHVALDVLGQDVGQIVRASMRDDALMRLERFRFLVASALVWFAFREIP